MTETVEDGRVARGQRTREAVIDALFDLYAEGNLTPTIEDIAGRVGRTTRSIYTHFQDEEALAGAMADRLLERHGELFTAHPPTGTRMERIHGIAAHRAEFFETVAPARRSALVRIHRAPELQRQQLLDLHTSWETWDRLRTWQRLSVDRSRHLMTGLLSQALER